MGVHVETLTHRIVTGMRHAARGPDRTSILDSGRPATRPSAGRLPQIGDTIVSAARHAGSDLLVLLVGSVAYDPALGRRVVVAARAQRLTEGSALGPWLRQPGERGRDVTAHTPPSLEPRDRS